MANGDVYQATRRMTSRQSVKPATEGMTFVLESKIPGVGDTTYTVRAKCPATAGNWICVSHPDLGAFRNQFYKDQHISRRGTHVLAWVCLEHGPEVP